MVMKMKRGQAIQIDGEWFAVIENMETGESYRLRCRDEAHAEYVVLRETM